MRSNSLYIVGWSGFIGRQYIKFLDKIGYTGDVYLYFRSDDYKKHEEKIENIKLTYVNYHEMIAGLLNKKATILYLANVFSPAESNANVIASAEMNIIPFLSFLEDIKNNAHNLTFVFSSSGGSIYGDTNGEACNENHRLAPKTIYSANKIAQETYLSVYGINYGLDYRIARIANPYGPGQFLNGGQGLIPAMLRASIDGYSLPVLGTGTATRDYIFIDDLCSFLYLLSSYSGNHRVFNAGSGSEYSILDVINCFNTVHVKPLQYHFVSSEASTVSRIVLDINLAKNELSWNPETSLPEGIKSFIDWSVRSN